MKRATPAQLLLLPVAFVAIAGVWLILVKLLLWLHWYPRIPPRVVAFRTPAAPFLLVLPALFTSFGPGLLISNLTARGIRSWRRVLDREAEHTPGGDYRSSQRALLRVTLAVLLVTAPLMAAGVLVGR